MEVIIEGQIYISTSCIKSRSIKESVSKLVSAGFKNIELSGGTKFYPNYKDDLLKMKKNMTSKHHILPSWNSLANTVLELASSVSNQ